MKNKLFSFFRGLTFLLCSLLASFGTASADVAPWWGTYCNGETSICLHVTNVDIKPEGIGFFRANFFDTEENELCSMLPIFEGEASQFASYAFYELAVSSDGATMTVNWNPQMAQEFEDGCTAALFGTYYRDVPPDASPNASPDPAVAACPTKRSDIKETPITLKKAFEAYHAYYITYDDMRGEHTLRVSYGDKDIYDTLVGKTMTMQYVDVQYYDEHDGECLQTQEVLALDDVKMSQ